ncbi:universal stress protein [Hyphomicrobium sp.]|uniref:universal stress protein n=1 Tax=Hyphomicrobium sp. TaxID=82 RepID=UPI0025C37B7D|nr:universal stress protein [Hyphomicrobium sp.]MCC7250767.1 universal stress protein [Hyphomicrobium sp.]
MFKHILIATDGSELAQKAVDQGLELAKALDAKVTAVTVTEPLMGITPSQAEMAFPIQEYERRLSENATRILSAAATSAERIGLTCATYHVVGKAPAEGILDTANERNCDLIVMASHGWRGLTRLLLGSQAHNVVTHSKVPVLICR